MNFCSLWGNCTDIHTHTHTHTHTEKERERHAHTHRVKKKKGYILIELCFLVKKPLSYDLLSS